MVDYQYLYGLLCGFPRSLRAYLRSDDPATIDRLSGLRAHGRITAGLAAAGNATRI
jgi:hypothetical protein